MRMQSFQKGSFPVFPTGMKVPALIPLLIFLLLASCTGNIPEPQENMQQEPPPQSAVEAVPVPPENAAFPGVRLEMPEQCPALKEFPCRLVLDAPAEKLAGMRIQITVREGSRTARIMQFPATPEREVAMKGLRAGNYAAQVTLLLPEGKSVPVTAVEFTVSAPAL